MTIAKVFISIWVKGLLLCMELVMQCMHSVDSMVRICNLLSHVSLICLVLYFPTNLSGDRGYKAEDLVYELSIQCG